MSSFTVTTAGTSVNLRPLSVKPGETAKGTASYTVTNRTGSTIRVRLRVEPDEGAEPGWFTVRDGDERDIPPGATANVSIDLAVPGGNTKRSFKLVVVNVADPDNDFEYGSTIAFDAPTIEKKESGLKWWMIAAPVALLVVVGGAILGFSQLSKKEPVTVTLDNFVGTPLEKAKATLEAEGIAVVEQARVDITVQQPEFFDKIVVAQAPESDGTLKIPRETEVKLSWTWKPKPDAFGERFVGHWVNENRSTRGITRVEINRRQNRLGVHMWGKCHPTDCDWGTEWTTITDSDDGVLSLTWTTNFSVRKQQLAVLLNGRMRVSSRTHFTDNSGRQDYNKTYYFVRR